MDMLIRQIDAPVRRQSPAWRMFDADVPESWSLYECHGKGSAGADTMLTNHFIAAPAAVIFDI